MASKVTHLERYQACMILHSVGDAMGYHNNKWEFNFVGTAIHRECKELGGIDELKLNKSLLIFHNLTIFCTLSITLDIFGDLRQMARQR